MTEEEKTEIKIKFIEDVFNIELFDWQKDFIFNDVPYDKAIFFARRAGKTFARCLKICFSDGQPIYIYKNQYHLDDTDFFRMAGEDTFTPERFRFFIREFKNIYKKLVQEGAPWLREIHFCNSVNWDEAVKEKTVVIKSTPIPTVDEVKEAAVIIKNFCISRDSDPETDCIECPIRDMCDSDPYTWEV